MKHMAYLQVDTWIFFKDVFSGPLKNHEDLVGQGGKAAVSPWFLSLFLTHLLRRGDAVLVSPGLCECLSVCHSRGGLLLAPPSISLWVLMVPLCCLWPDLEL